MHAHNVCVWLLCSLRQGIYFKPSNISDATKLSIYFNDCIKYTLIVQSPVCIDCFIREYLVIINVIKLKLILHAKITKTSIINIR